MEVFVWCGICAKDEDKDADEEGADQVEREARVGLKT